MEEEMLAKMKTNKERMDAKIEANNEKFEALQITCFLDGYPPS
jgi:hypothetical protein